VRNDNHAIAFSPRTTYKVSTYWDRRDDQPMRNSVPNSQTAALAALFATIAITRFRITDDLTSSITNATPAFFCEQCVRER
jgi:hypothetical protein